MNGEALDARPDAASTPDDAPRAPPAAAGPEPSGIHPLFDSREAFAARLALAQRATRSLDVQYYIWRNDTTGRLLFEALCAAAERGVRVRLLLDDNNTSDLDEILATLDAHPGIEVRLFNPFALRRPRIVGYLTDFFRLNRRMHNKSFTADRETTIVGGRNIGDEYFGATGDVLFVDLDVLAVGPIVADVADDFERYWASKAACPVERLLPRRRAARSLWHATGPRRPGAHPARDAYVAAIGELAFGRALVERRLPLTWAPTHMVSDDPAKVFDRGVRKAYLPRQIVAIVGTPRATFDIVSPYFVPGASGVRTFARLARQGVRVRVLTNAFEATDVAAVHAGYSKRRKALLEAGVALFELRRTSAVIGAAERGGHHAGRLGSSGSSLHAKTFAVDGTRVFVGSYNFDPRSAKLNTELGFVIESAALTQHIAATFENAVPGNAYEVRLTPQGTLYWIERGAGGEVRHDVEPGTRWWQRALVRLLGKLPLEWLL
jgi:putative cardiolipin synthase